MNHSAGTKADCQHRRKIAASAMVTPSRLASQPLSRPLQHGVTAEMGALQPEARRQMPGYLVPVLDQFGAPSGLQEKIDETAAHGKPEA